MNLSHICDRLSFFQELYRKNRNRQAELFNRFERYLAQYKGDKEIDRSSEAASVVRNITYELVESQVSTQIPAPCAQAKHYTEQNDRNAKAIERLCTQLRDELPFEKLNDQDERYTYIYGGSVWLAEWDNTLLYRGVTGGVRVSCLNPLDFVPEAGVYEIEDMEYCFLRFSTTKNAIIRRFALPESEIPLLSAEGNEDDIVEMIVCFWKDDEGHICQFIYSGDAVLSDVEDYYARKTQVCKRCGKKRLLCHCDTPSLIWASEEEEILTEDIHLEDGRVIPALSPVIKDGFCEETLAPTRLPYYRPHHFPIVIRKNTSEEKSLFGQSDCEFIRPQQQQINKIETRILQKLMRSGITPILPDDAELTLDNSVFGQVIKLRTGDEKERYGVLDTTPSIAQDIQQSERLYEHAKRILGITDTYLGMSDSTAQSGFAKQIQVEQAAGRLDSKRKMKQAAYADLDRILFEFYLAYADEPRPLSYRDAFGKPHHTAFSRYDFLIYDTESGTYTYDDGFLFSVDQNGAIEQQRDALWQKNLENLQAGTLGDPADPATLLHYWQCQERAHYPYARENVEYFQALTEKEQAPLPQDAPAPPERSPETNAKKT